MSPSPRNLPPRAGRHSAPPRIYCAGPPFNEHERGEMAAIARMLESAGFAVFLPHRDAFVFADILAELVQGGYEPAEAAPLIQRAIFCLDSYEVLAGCQGLVLNLNGRVPDEGGVAEAAMAWTAGLPVVLYKDDARTAVHGYDNPLVSGLGYFVHVSTLPEIAYAFTQLFKRRAAAAPAFPKTVRSVLDQGKRLSRALHACQTRADIAAAMVRVIRDVDAGQ